MKFKTLLADYGMLTEGALNAKNLSDNPSRIDTLIDFINSGKELKKIDGTTVVLKKSKENLKTAESLKKYKRGQKYFFKDIDGIDHNLTSLEKTGDFGSTKGSANKEDKTTLQEVGVILALDGLVNLGEFNTKTYIPSSVVKIAADYKSVIEFLELDQSWYKASVNSAKSIIKNIPNLKGYEFHHDSSTFKSIRTTGKKLTGLNSDKWNPSDIYLIKNYSPDTSSFMKFNEYIGSNDDVIGISLKKGEKEALHGGYSLKKVAEEFNLVLNWNSKLDDKYRKEIINHFSNIQKKSPFDIIVKEGAGDTLSDQIMNMTPVAASFNKSFLTGLSFVDKLSNMSREKAEDILKFTILRCMSISPKSCSHYKIEGNKFSNVPSGKKIKIDIGSFRLKTNGSADNNFDFSFNGKPMKLQLRSKGSLPQFMINKIQDKWTGISLKSLKL